MACGTCGTCDIIARAGEVTPGTHDWSFRSQVDLALLEKSAGNGCLSSQLIQRIVQAGRPSGPPSRIDGPMCYIGIKEGSFCIDAGYWQEGDMIPRAAILFPFAIRETSWKLIPVDTFTEPETPTFESSLPTIRAWVRRCNLDHSCIGGREVGKLPTRIIDVGDALHQPRLYVSRGERGRFAALSHCWGPLHTSSRRLTTTLTNLGMHCNQLPLDQFPQTFRDAVMIVRALGLRYIWIDSLCIIQDSLEDWGLESSRMAHVYSDAYIILAADFAANSDAGLFVTETCHANRPPQVRQFSQVDDDGASHQIFVRQEWPVPGGPRDKARSCYASEAVSKLGSRGWALQENILSRRIVHFTNAELVWECLASHECSCGNAVPRGIGLKGRVFGSDRHPFIEPGDDAVEPSCYFWHRIVAEFSLRQVTYPTDRLPALSGLAKVMPFPETDYLAGLWRKNLPHDLIWINSVGHQTTCSGRIAGEYAPTWSWASISAPVAFGILHTDIAGVVQEWRIIAATCAPITSNPYGSVSRDSSLQAEGYMIPISVQKQAYEESDGHLRVERTDGAFHGWNLVWMDAGVEANEWCVEGYEYYVLVIGYRKMGKVPLALVLRDKLDGTGRDEYTRIGLVRLDNWAGCEWKLGQRQRVVTIF